MTRTGARHIPLALAVAALALGCVHLGGEAQPAADAELLERMERARAAREQPAEPEPRRETAESRLARGDQLREAGDPARALWQYLQAHQLDGENPRPLTRIASLHLAREPLRAEAIFRSLVADDAGDGVSRTGLGLALLAQERFEEAAAELLEATQRAPRLAAAFNGLGVALDHLGRREEAQNAFRRAAGLAPRSHEPLNNLGVSLLASGQPALAARVLEQATLLEPRDPAVRNNMGLALGRLGRYDEALAAFRRAGTEPEALNNLGYVQYLNGEHERALDAYERALLAGGDAELRLRVLRNLRAARRARDARAGETPPAALAEP